MSKTDDSDETPFSEDEQEGEGGFPCDEPGCDYVGTSLHQLWGHKGKMHPKTEEKRAAKAATKAPPKKGQVKRSPSPNPYPEPGSMTDEIDKAMGVQGGYKQQVKPIVNEMNVLRNFLEMSGLGAYTEPVVALFEVSPADDYDALEEAMTVNGIGKPRRDLIVKLWKTHMGEEEDEDTPEDEETSEKKSGGKKLGVMPYKDPRTVDAAMFMNMTPGQKAQFQRDLQSLLEAEKLLSQVNQQVFQQTVNPYGGMMSPYGFPMVQQQQPVQMVPMMGPNGQVMYMPMQQPFPMGQAQQPQRDPETQALIEWMKKSKEEEEERKRMEPLYNQMRRFNEAIEDMKAGQKPQHTDPMAAMKELMALKAMANMAGDSEGAKRYDLQIQQLNANAESERRNSQQQLAQMQGQQNQLMIQAMQTQMNAQVEMARKEAELAKAGKPKDVMETLNDAQRIREMMENFSGGGNNQAGAEADAKAREREALWNNLGKIAETVAPIIGQSLAGGQMATAAAPASAPAAMPMAPNTIQARCNKCGQTVTIPNRNGTYPCPTPGCGAVFDVTMPVPNAAPQPTPVPNMPPMGSMPTAPPPTVMPQEMDERAFLMNQDMDMLYAQAARVGVDINPHMPPGKNEIIGAILAAKAQRGN